MMRTRALILTALLLVPAVAAADETPLLEIREIAGGVYAFFPTEEAMEGWKAISNSAAVELEDGILIYDSHWTPAHAAEAGKLLRQYTDKPIRYVVASHFHGDHTGGAWAYAGKVEMITHHRTRELLEKDLAELPDELPGDIARQEERLESVTDPVMKDRMTTVLRYNKELLSRVQADAPVPLPTLTFDSGVVLHRGKRVEVHFLGRGHTEGDAIVFLPNEKIAFVGDLVFRGMLPNLNDGFSAEWIATLEKILELGAAYFVPGHGPLTDADGVREQIAYLRWLRSAVEPFVRDGAGAEAAVEAISLPEEYADFGFAMFLPGNVAKVYGELEAEMGDE